MTQSQWAETRTFFPLFLAALERQAYVDSVVVVGAADGKFVVPLAQAGYKVIAVDINGSALFGTTSPGGQPHERYDAGGLVGTLYRLGLADNVTIVNQDICKAALSPAAAVWTSCSWHYSLNHGTSLSAFIDALTRCIHPDGLFGAEYFMPVAVAHVEQEHYLEQGEIWRYLPGWQAVGEAYTPPFVEAPHLGQPTPHIHRMGFVLARR